MIEGVIEKEWKRCKGPPSATDMMDAYSITGIAALPAPQVDPGACTRLVPTATALLLLLLLRLALLLQLSNRPELSSGVTPCPSAHSRVRHRRS